MSHSKAWLLLISVLALLTTGLTQEHAPVAPAPIGKLFDLGGYKLHLYCTGKGMPAVVLSIGSGDFSFDWMPVQQRISSFTKVCSYDRGGEAWSDLGPNPHTYRQEAYDLHRLLKAAEIRGPYVMVGQSMGG